MKRILFALIFTFVAFAAHAQIPAGGVVDPTKLEFVPSPDHNAVNALTGAPVLTNYEAVAIGMNGSGAIAVTVNLLKPTPVANLITITQGPFLQMLTQMTGNQWYTASVNAVGPDGVNGSGPSNPFAKKIAQKPGSATSVAVR